MNWVPPKWFWIVVNALDFNKLPTELLLKLLSLGWDALRANLTLVNFAKLVVFVELEKNRVLGQAAMDAWARRPGWMQ